MNLMETKGKKIIEGDVADLLDPAHTLVQLDTTDNEKVRHYLAASRWAAFVQQANGLDLMMNKEEVPELISELVANDVRILSVNSSHSLENYFLSLTTQQTHVHSFAN